MSALPTLATIRAAADRIGTYIHRTPIFTSKTLNHLTGQQLFFKCENLQKVGAFKFRGATNAVFSLTADEAKHGVATHSSGNHAAALALAARLRGVPAYIIMPRTAPPVKKRAVESYGGIISLCEPTQAAREETAAQVVAATGAVFIHPYNDARVIAGQGTATLELLADVPDLDVILTPVGGGGLLSGTALAAKGLSPAIRVIGAEPAGADDAFRSYYSKQLQPLGQPNTIADGLRTSLGTLTFPLIQQYVDGIITVTEPEIINAMRTVWEYLKIIIEPSSAVPVAVALSKKLEPPDQKIGIILSGGNVDLDHLPWQA